VDIGDGQPALMQMNSNSTIESKMVQNGEVSKAGAIVLGKILESTRLTLNPLDRKTFIAIEKAMSIDIMMLRRKTAIDHLLNKSPERTAPFSSWPIPPSPPPNSPIKAPRSDALTPWCAACKQ
jgi:hypothetical protein